MKLSIITINYNNCDGLQKTIDSVIAQTWRDFEWIVIDGGSTDGSKELLEQYKEHFSYWCSEPDKGIYNAMNKGIAKANGDYLNFMNSGDAFYEKMMIFCMVTGSRYIMSILKLCITLHLLTSMPCIEGIYVIKQCLFVQSC